MSYAQLLPTPESSHPKSAVYDTLEHFYSGLDYNQFPTGIFSNKGRVFLNPEDFSGVPEQEMNKEQF